MTKTDIFQYSMIFLVVLWPVWVLSFVFLRALVLNIGSILKGRKVERLAVPRIIQPVMPVEKPVGLR